MDAAEQDLVELESLVRAQSKDNLVENEVEITVELVEPNPEAEVAIEIVPEVAATDLEDEMSANDRKPLVEPKEDEITPDLEDDLAQEVLSLVSLSNTNDNEIEAMDLEVADYLPVPTNELSTSQNLLHVSQKQPRRMSRLNNKLSDEMNAKMSGYHSKKGVIIMVFIVALVVLLLVVMGVYWGTKKKDIPDEVPKAEE